MRGRDPWGICARGRRKADGEEGPSNTLHLGLRTCRADGWRQMQVAVNSAAEGADRSVRRGGGRRTPGLCTHRSDGRAEGLWERWW